MTQLANADLLDESVANSSSLKNKRLSKTAQTASNPNPNPIQNPMQPKSPVLKKVDMEEDDDDLDVNERADNFQKFQNDYMNQSNTNEKEKKSDGKILGMPKGVAIGLGVVVLGVAAYFGYKYYKKNKLKSISVPNTPSLANSVSNSIDVGTAIPNVIKT